MRSSLSFLSLSLSVVSLAALASCRDDTLTELSGGVTGQVCNPVTGRPAPGATVTATFTNPATKKAGEKTTTADAEGNYTLAGLPVTTVALHVEVPDDFTNDIKDVEIAATQNSQLKDPACRDTPADPGFGTLVGKVCNRHTGDIVTNGVVIVQLADGTTLQTNTDPATGNFELADVPAGPQIVRISGDGFQKTVQVDIKEGDAPTELIDAQLVCEPYDPLTTGMIVGQLCGTDQPGDPGGPLAGAHVFIVNGIDGSTYEDETIADGSFTIAGIPTPQAGLQVRAEKGGFIFTWDNVAVNPISDAPDGTNLTATVGCQPLSPDDGRHYLVVKGIYDRIEHVLQRMGIQPDLIDGNPIDFHDWTLDAFGDPATLETYDAVFLNCGVEEAPLLLSGLSGAVRTNIKAYVQGGGSLYVSDWAYDYVEQIWPDKINFLRDDTVNSDAQFGAGKQTYTARILDDGLAQYVGAQDLQVDIKFDNFAVISQVAPGVRTFLQADEKYHVNGGQTALPDTPMTVGFSDGLGQVIFTSFHQEQDASALCSADGDCNNGLSCIDGACTAALDGPEDQVMRYLIFSL